MEAHPARRRRLWAEGVAIFLMAAVGAVVTVLAFVPGSMPRSLAHGPASTALPSPPSAARLNALAEKALRTAEGLRYRCHAQQAANLVQAQGDVLSIPDGALQGRSQGQVVQWPSPRVYAQIDCPSRYQTGCTVGGAGPCPSVVRYSLLAGVVEADPNAARTSQKWAVGFTEGGAWMSSSNRPWSRLRPVTGLGCETVPAPARLQVHSTAADPAMVYDRPATGVLGSDDPDAIRLGVLRIGAIRVKGKPETAPAPKPLAVLNCLYSQSQYVQVQGSVLDPRTGTLKRVTGFIWADESGGANGFPGYPWGISGCHPLPVPRGLEIYSPVDDRAPLYTRYTGGANPPPLDDSIGWVLIGRGVLPSGERFDAPAPKVLGLVACGDQEWVRVRAQASTYPTRSNPNGAVQMVTAWVWGGARAHAQVMPPFRLFR